MDEVLANSAERSGLVVRFLPAIKMMNPNDLTVMLIQNGSKPARRRNAQRGSESTPESAEPDSRARWSRPS